MLKDAIWFIKISKKFTGYGYMRMLFKEHLIKRTIIFVKHLHEYNRLVKKYGSYKAYLMTNRVIEM